jgi:hypothetical protein
MGNKDAKRREVKKPKKKQPTQAENQLAAALVKRIANKP